MGIRMQRNTWSSPLLLINSWLPSPSETTTRPNLTAVAQRFARAGWLGRNAGLKARSSSALPRSGTQVEPSPQLRAHPPTAVRMVRTTACSGVHRKGDSRVVLSGRMADVCAELERLAAMEPAPISATH